MRRFWADCEELDGRTEGRKDGRTKRGTVESRPNEGGLGRKALSLKDAPVIGVGRTDWVRSPLPPNRTCGSPASGSPVGGIASKRIDGPNDGRRPGKTAHVRRRRCSLLAHRVPVPSTCDLSRSSVLSTPNGGGPLRQVESGGGDAVARTLRPVALPTLWSSRIHLPASLCSTGITRLPRSYGRSDS